MRVRAACAIEWRSLVVILALCGVVGCGGNNSPLVVPKPAVPTGLPTPAAAGPVNTYAGAQSPGVWSFTIDNTKSAFSYAPQTPGSMTTSGGLQASGGFLLLSNAGLAYELLGRAALLRPGDATTPPVFGVPQTQCYAINGRLRFQYIPMFPGVEDSGNLDAFHGAPFLGYGSVVASTDAQGANWQFENLQSGTWTPSESTSGSIVSGPDAFTGQCSASGGNASITASGNSLIDTFVTPDGASLTAATQTQVWIGPSGLIVANEVDPSQPGSPGASVAGVAEPSTALPTSTMASGQYLGILYEAANDANYGNGAPPSNAQTLPVGFGQVVPGSGSTITGGTFPNDNVSAAPNTDIQIKLGSQDATLHGLYPSVSITVPDPAQNCANFVFFSLSGVVSSSLDANGYPTCTFPGVAIAGNPEGKFVIFINSYNWAVDYGGAPMQLYLFQQ